MSASGKHWTSTTELRWQRVTVTWRGLFGLPGGEHEETVLQQLWQASDGETEWRNIEVVDVE